MKKFFLIIVYFIISITCVLASEWKEISNKSYIDVSSIQQDSFGYRYAWLKLLNDGTFKPIKNKKIHYIMAYHAFDCSLKKVDQISVTSYGLSGEVLESWEMPNYSPKYSMTWLNVVPDTNGEIWFYLVCF
jgi:hypothetical protein